MCYVRSNLLAALKCIDKLRVGEFILQTNSDVLKTATHHFLVYKRCCIKLHMYSQNLSKMFSADYNKINNPVNLE